MRFHHVVSTLLLAAFAAAMVAACGGSPANSGAPARSPSTHGGGMCPVAVPGTSVSAEDAGSGGALAFVTTGDVAEVRTRVAAMAAMHNDHHGKMGALPASGEGMDHSKMGGDMEAMDHSQMHGGMDHSKMGGDMEGMDHSKMNGMMMVSTHSTAAAEDIEGGARLVFTSGPDDVAALQSELRMHAQHMASGTCSMGGK